MTGFPSIDELAARLLRAGCVAAREEAVELLEAAADPLALEHLVARREQGEPLAWLTGRTVFCDRVLAVAVGCYVPRGQSEPLARRAAGALPRSGRAADLCTGVGAVAAHLGAAVPGAVVVGTDLDPVALACARANGVRVLQADLGDGLVRGAFDVVTAVAPYVPTGELAFLPTDVLRFEPRLALDGGPDGCGHLRRVVRSAARLLRAGGSLFLELGGEEDERLAPTLVEVGFSFWTTWRDDEGDLRGLAARLGGATRRYPRRSARRATREAANVQLGMVGLGRMGANLVRRLQRAGHECVVYDVSPDAVAALEREGATGARSLEELAAKLTAPRAVWVMVPAGEITRRTIDELAAHLEADDVVIDGGNTYYRDDLTRAAALAARHIHYVDVGTSGGVWGLERGYCLMIGGEEAVVDRLRPIFEAIAPGVDAAARTPGRDGEATPAEHGYLHCGPAGAGHFVKMVHNGIEYGVMAAYAEGLNILRHANAGNLERQADAETAPLENPDAYRYELDLKEVAEVWRRGSVIASWLLDLTAAALVRSPDLDDFAGRVSDSGEGRWTAIAAIEEGVPAPTLTTALFSRFASRDLDRFANQALSAMRSEFGGHAEKPADPSEKG